MPALPVASAKPEFVFVSSQKMNVTEETGSMFTKRTVVVAMGDDSTFKGALVHCMWSIRSIFCQRHISGVKNDPPNMKPSSVTGLILEEWSENRPDNATDGLAKWSTSLTLKDTCFDYYYLFFLMPG